MYREILTKAIIAKGEKSIKEQRTIDVNKKISKVLGCWIINNKQAIKRIDQTIYVDGTYDAYFWFGYDNDTACDLYHKNFTYSYEIPFTFTQENLILDDEIIIKDYVNKVPTCTSMKFNNTNITIDVEYKISIDIIGETKLRIKVDDVTIDQMINTNYVKDNK